MRLFCSTCNLKFSSKAYNSHQFFHRQTFKSFKCTYSNCSLIFKKYSNFKTHLMRSKHTGNNLISNSTFFSCHICNYKINIRTLFYKYLYQHIRDGISLNCPFIKSCKVEKTFSRYEALRTHFVRRHSRNSIQKTLLENNEDTGLINITNDINIQNIAQETLAEQLPCDNGNILENISLKLLDFFVFKVGIKTFPDQ